LPNRLPAAAAAAPDRVPCSRWSRQRFSGADAAEAVAARVAAALIRPIMSEEVAAQAALDIIQQVPPELNITAGADSVEFVEPRGQSQFKIDGKNATVEVPGGTIKVKSRWDRGTLRQEFSSAQRTLKRSWSIDDQAHLVLAQHIESINVMTKEARAVFDRQ
jgi:hypothetical protein